MTKIISASILAVALIVCAVIMLHALTFTPHYSDKPYNPCNYDKTQSHIYNSTCNNK